MIWNLILLFAIFNRPSSSVESGNLINVPRTLSRRKLTRPKDEPRWSQSNFPAPETCIALEYSWSKRGENCLPLCGPGELLPKAMNNKILKSTDENINMNFFLPLARWLRCSLACAKHSPLFLVRWLCLRWKIYGPILWGKRENTRARANKHFASIAGGAESGGAETSLFLFDGDRNSFRIKYDLCWNGQFVKSCWKWLEIH